MAVRLRDMAFGGGMDGLRGVRHLGSRWGRGNDPAVGLVKPGVTLQTSILLILLPNTLGVWGLAGPTGLQGICLTALGNTVGSSTSVALAVTGTGGVVVVASVVTTVVHFDSAKTFKTFRLGRSFLLRFAIHKRLPHAVVVVVVVVVVSGV